MLNKELPKFSRIYTYSPTQYKLLDSNILKGTLFLFIEEVPCVPNTKLKDLDTAAVKNYLSQYICV
jgi:hypothetical protein